MLPWILLDSAPIPGGGGELRLLRRGDEFSIRIAGRGELMNSRAHGSEAALADLPRADAEVVVAERVPAVVIWNRGPLAAGAGEPLADPRVTVREDDVARVIAAAPRGYDAILLDVDNGPEGLTRSSFDCLYDFVGLNAAYAALRPQGRLHRDGAARAGAARQGRAPRHLVGAAR